MRGVTKLLIFGGVIALGLSWALPRANAPLDRQSVALDLIADGRASDAVHLLDDHIWKGIAEYRANRFRRAAAEFIQDESVTSLYNLGTANARLAEWGAARAAYEKVLRLDPGHEDAAYNLSLVLQAEERQREEHEAQQDARTLGTEKGDPNRADPEANTDGSETTAEDAQPSHNAAPSEREPNRSGQIAAAGRTGDDAVNEQGAVGRADAPGLEDRDASGQMGSGGMRILTESTRQAEALLRAIKDDPERVLAARLRAIHRQRQEMGE